MKIFTRTYDNSKISWRFYLDPYSAVNVLVEQNDVPSAIEVL